MKDLVANEHKEYLIIGAGPSGLQLGYYLEKANRDYLILEPAFLTNSAIANHITLALQGFEHSVYPEQKTTVCYSLST